MARHGRHGAPRAAVRAPSAPAAGPFGFSRVTRNESRDPKRGLRRPFGSPWERKVASRKTAARSLLPCALRSGMGRLWRGMGGMGRPEPQSAHHPHRQHAHSGFHETRDPKHETRLLPGARRGVPSGPARIPRFSRNTKHETRNTAFFRITAFCRVGRQVMREGGQARRLQGWMYEARENEWKGVFLNPETGITTFSESRFGSRFGIRHNSSQFVGKIRISPYRQSSAPAHCGNRDIGFMDVSRPRRPSLARRSRQVAKRRTNGSRIAKHSL